MDGHSPCCIVQLQQQPLHTSDVSPLHDGSDESTHWRTSTESERPLVYTWHGRWTLWTPPCVVALQSWSSLALLRNRSLQLPSFLLAAYGRAIFIPMFLLICFTSSEDIDVMDRCIERSSHPDQSISTQCNTKLVGKSRAMELVAIPLCRRISSHLVDWEMHTINRKQPRLARMKSIETNLLLLQLLQGLGAFLCNTANVFFTHMKLCWHHFPCGVLLEPMECNENILVFDFSGKIGEDGDKSLLITPKVCPESPCVFHNGSTLNLLCRKTDELQSIDHYITVSDELTSVNCGRRRGILLFLLHCWTMYWCEEGGWWCDEDGSASENGVNNKNGIQI